MLRAPLTQPPPPANPLTVAVVVSKPQLPRPVTVWAVAQVSLPGGSGGTEMFRRPVPAELVSFQLPTWIRYWSPPVRLERTIFEEYSGAPPLSSSEATHVAPQSEPACTDSFVSSLPTEPSVSIW